MSATLTPSVLTGKRVNFILSEKAHSDLTALSRETKRSMTELEAERKGHRLVVTTSDGQPIKEIVLPG